MVNLTLYSKGYSLFLVVSLSHLTPWNKVDPLICTEYPDFPAGPVLHPVQQLLGGDLHDGRLPAPPPRLLQPPDDRQDQGLHQVQVSATLQQGVANLPQKCMRW